MKIVKIKGWASLSDKEKRSLQHKKHYYNAFTTDRAKENYLEKQSDKKHFQILLAMIRGNDDNVMDGHGAPDPEGTAADGREPSPDTTTSGDTVAESETASDGTAADGREPDVDNHPNANAKVKMAFEASKEASRAALVAAKLAGETINLATEAIKADQVKALAKKAEFDRDTEQIRLEALREERTILQLKMAVLEQGQGYM